jgi:hypothetical protein
MRTILYAQVAWKSRPNGQPQVANPPQPISPVLKIGKYTNFSFTSG